MATPYVKDLYIFGAKFVRDIAAGSCGNKKLVIVLSKLHPDGVTILSHLFQKISNIKQ